MLCGSREKKKCAREGKVSRRMTDTNTGNVILEHGLALVSSSYRHLDQKHTPAK